MTAQSNINKWERLVRYLALAALGILPIFSIHAQQISVTDSGTPTYSYPIVTPPGIAGMAPNVGLLYSGGLNGPVGYGWTLQGISMITRCPNTKAIDGSIRGVGYTKDDKLCLDGQRLIQTDANGAPINGANTNPGSANPFQINDSLGGSGMVREYRTEKDIYARVRAYGAAGNDPNNGPAYFKVWTKSGQIYEYGVNSNGSANAQIAAQGKPVIVAWPVSRISDTVGNYIDFQYEQRDFAWGSNNSSGHEWNLIEIRYTGNGAQAPTNKVLFTYEDRSPTAVTGPGNDRSEAFHLGSKNVSIRRLAKIQTMINITTAPVVVKSIKLAYDNGPVTNRSRLIKITECNGKETQCLPSTTFNYAAGGGTGYTTATLFNLAGLPMQNTAGTYGVLAGDFNGDGKTDIVRWSDIPSQNQLYYSNGDGTFKQAANFNVTSQNLFSSNGCFMSMVADFNGDGLPDILRYSNSLQSDNKTACPSQGNVLFLNQGNGTFNTAALSGMDIQREVSQSYPTCTTGYECSASGPPVQYWTNWTEGKTFYVFDVDGDGYLDIVTTTLPAGQTQPAYFSMPQSFDPAPCANIVCTKVYKGDGKGNFTQIATNVANETLYATQINKYTLGEPANITDFDQDGLADIINSGNPFVGMKNRGWRSRGDGNFDPINVPIPCSYPADFNGDGKTDCVIVDIFNKATNALYASDGTSTLQRVTNSNISSLALISRDPTTAAQISGVSILDIDGDGRSDILDWNDSASLNVLYLSNGDGTFRQSSVLSQTGAIQFKKSDGSADFVVADFTGHGNIEFLLLSAAGNSLGIKSDPTPADQLMSVTTGTGLTTALTWVPLSNSVSGNLGARYANDRGTSNAATYPMMDYTFPMYVVATTTADSGVSGGKLVTEYSYAGLKAAYDGRGSLGFRETRRQSPTPDNGTMTVLTQRLQQTPYVGVASLTQSWLGTLNAADPTLLSRTTNLYCDKNAAAGAEGTATITAPCVLPASAKIQRPYLYQSREEGWDPGTHAGLPTVTTTNTFDNGGNPTQIVVNTSGTALGLSQNFNKITTNLYQPDNISGDHWILGRLQRATVQSSVPNSLASISTSAGTAPNASAVKGTLQPLTVSISPAVISKTQVNSPNFSATAAVTVMGGPTGALTYSWNRSSATTTRVAFSGTSSEVFSATLAMNENINETFTVTVKDSIGRMGTASIPVNFHYVPVVASISPGALALTRNNPGTVSGIVTASATGGTAPYSYNWVRTAGTRSTISSATAANPAISAALNWNENFTETWKVVATDAAGNTATANVNASFKTPAQPTVSISPSPLTINAAGAGTGAGAATANVTGGVAPYSYAWVRTAGTRSNVSNAAIVNPIFSAALNWNENFTETWRFTATDAASNTATASVNVKFTTPSPLSVSASPSSISFSNVRGGGTYGTTVTATAAGGTAGYAYRWVDLNATSGFTITNATSATARLTSPSVACGTSRTRASTTFRVTATDSRGLAATTDVPMYVAATWLSTGAPC